MRRGFEAREARALEPRVQVPGRPYDFEFDFFSDATWSPESSNVVRAGAEQTGPSRWSWSDVAGRPPLPANEIVMKLFERSYGKPSSNSTRHILRWQREGARRLRRRLKSSAVSWPAREVGPRSKETQSATARPRSRPFPFAAPTVTALRSGRRLTGLARKKHVPYRRRGVNLDSAERTPPSPRTTLQTGCQSKPVTGRNDHAPHLERTAEP